MRPPRLPPLREDLSRAPWRPRWRGAVRKGLGRLPFHLPGVALRGGWLGEGEVWHVEVRQVFHLPLRPGALEEAGVQAALRGAAQVLSLEAGPAPHLPGFVLDWLGEVWWDEVASQLHLARPPRSPSEWERVMALAEAEDLDLGPLELLRFAQELPQGKGPVPQEVAWRLERLRALLEEGFPKPHPFALVVEETEEGPKAVEADTALVPALVVAERGPWEEAYLRAVEDYLAGNAELLEAAAGVWWVAGPEEAERLGKALRLALELLAWVAEGYGLHPLPKPPPRQEEAAWRTRHLLPVILTDPPEATPSWEGEEALLD